MAITGGIKFFKKSKSLTDDGNTMLATSGIGAEVNALDRNRFTFWRSVGSSDSITETLILTFSEATTLDRILLIDHNFKEFTVKYDLSGAFVDFTSVTGIDGALGGGIAETTFADDTAYYEFASVTTTRLEITVTKTQVVDAQKFISMVNATEELGTFQGYPILKSIKRSRNSRTKKMLSGRMNIQKSEETVRFRLDFKNYPPGLTSDADLVYTLFDSEDPFQVWLCGGRRGSDFFTYTLRGFDMKRILRMQVDKDLSSSYSKNVYVNMINTKLSLVEHV